MWATRPHLGSIFVKLLHRKTFICLRLAPSSPIYIFPLQKRAGRTALLFLMLHLHLFDFSVQSNL
ncbi:MAG: hypothetical protein UD299_00930 [Ruminococcus sp.]|nr:hypothetical protein [Ruminococcus sp.]